MLIYIKNVNKLAPPFGQSKNLFVDISNYDK